MNELGKFKLSEDRYLEIKDYARVLYSEYNSLPRIERRQYLATLPELDNEYEQMILRTTLIFPDTKELVSMPEGQLLNYLKNFKEHDNVALSDITFKILEYKLQGTRDLVVGGKMRPMREIVYPDSSVAEEEYLNIKKSALANVAKFQRLTILEKSQLICDRSLNHFRDTKVQLATLLIPDDATLMTQLENDAPIEEVANYYNVPVSVIKFKQEEYRIQGTKRLIEEGKLPKSNPVCLWYKDPIHDPVINNIFNQAFYQEIEKGYIANAVDALESIFSKPIRKTKH